MYTFKDMSLNHKHYVIPEQVRPVCVKHNISAEQLRVSVSDQITCTPDTITSPMFIIAHHLISITITKRLSISLPHPESSIPQLSSQEWQPVVREKADIIMYWLASEFSEGLTKNELHNKISYSTGANLVNTTHRNNKLGLYLDGCVWLDTTKL